MATQNQQPVLIISGMHRSGTSLTASLLQSAGLDIGRQLLHGDEFNHKGYFENTDILAFHERILHAVGISIAGWTIQSDITPPECFVDEAKQLIDEHASATQPWGWKEPRTTLFLDFWGSLLPKAKFLLVYRAPWEVMDSLFRRGDETFHHHPEFALQAWLSYNRRILEFYRREPERCLLVNVSAITQAPNALIDAIQRKLGISLCNVTADLYEPSLLKQSGSSSQRQTLIRNYFPDSFNLYDQMNSVADLAALQAYQDFGQMNTAATAWILQDWLVLRQLERKLQQERQTTQQAQTQVNALQTQLAQQQQESLVLQNYIQALEQNQQSVNEQLQTSLHHVEQLQHQIGQAQAGFAESHEQMQQHWQTRIAEVRSRLDKKKEVIQQKNELLQQFNQQIAAIESSKFWKLRTLWFRLKGKLGIPVE
jgi:hypothetical protein